MLQWLYNVRHYFERHGFYVCSRLADRLGMRARSVRLFFIYLSFATLGVWFAIYLVLGLVSVKGFSIHQKDICI